MKTLVWKLSHTERGYMVGVNFERRDLHPLHGQGV